MPKLRVHAFGMSLDGYGAGPNQDLENPLGYGTLADRRHAAPTLELLTSMSLSESRCGSA